MKLHGSRAINGFINSMNKKIDISLVGLGHHSPPFDVVSELKKCVPTLQREPSNKHDKNAVKVLLKGHMVGYIDTKSAVRVSAILETGVKYQIKFREQYKSSIGMDFIFEFNDKLIKYPELAIEKQIGIYKISFKNDAEVYIGQSNQLNDRLKAHWKELHSYSHANINLQKSWINYGERNIKVSIIEVPPDNINSEIRLQKWLEERERYWIKAYKSKTTCMNITDGELVLTKKAINEFTSGQKVFDARIRSEKKVIKEQIELVSKQYDDQNKIYWNLSNQVNGLRAFLSKNTGLIGFFMGHATNADKEKKKKELDDLLPVYNLALSKRDAIHKTLKALKDKHKSLKTVRQISKFGAMSKSNYPFSVGEKGLVRIAAENLPEAVLSNILSNSAHVQKPDKNKKTTKASQNNKGVKQNNKVISAVTVPKKDVISASYEGKNIVTDKTKYLENNSQRSEYGGQGGGMVDYTSTNQMHNLHKVVTRGFTCPKCSLKVDKEFVIKNEGMMMRCPKCNQAINYS